MSKKTDNDNIEKSSIGYSLCEIMVIVLLIVLVAVTCVPKVMSNLAGDGVVTTDETGNMTENE